MAIFDAAVPANSESVKIGAQRIRELKTGLNTSLAVLLNDDNTVKNASIPLAALAAPLGATQIADDSITPAKLKQQAFQYAAGVYASNNYTVTLAPVAAALVVGMVVRFIADTANAGAVTLTVNSNTAHAIKKSVTTDLAAGDIAINQVVEVVWDGTNFQIVSPWVSLIPAARPSEAKAWVKFDGTPSSAPAALTAPTFTVNTSTKVITTASSLSLTTGQGVGVYSAGTLPGGLAVETLYYVRVLGGSPGTSFAIYTTAADANADTNRHALTGGSGTWYFLAAIIGDSFNVKAVVPVLNAAVFATGFTRFNSYDIYFDTVTPAVSNFATVGSGSPFILNGFAGFVSVDPSDPGLLTKKRITTFSYLNDGIIYTSGLPRTSVVFFWN